MTVNSISSKHGFTLIELMIVVAIIGILAAIAYPNYQRYVIKSKRTDMMSEMHNIATEIESRKLAAGSYSNISAKVKTDFVKAYPTQGQGLYDVTIAPDQLTAKWTIKAEPKPNSQMANASDGTLTLNHQGIKCRAAICGSSSEWNE